MSKSIRRIQKIIEKINHINDIVHKFDGKISKALEDIEVYRPAILMHLVAIAEQFDKLKKEDKEILHNFSTTDLKGIYDIRTFIAHDYEGINLPIIETSIRYGLPTLFQICNKLADSKF